MSRTDLQTLPERAVELLGGEPDDTTLRRYLHGLPGVDAVGLEQRRRGPRHPLDQDDVEGMGARQDHRAHRPHDPRGRRHAGQGALARREGAESGCRGPDLSAGGGRLRLRRHGALRRRGARRRARRSRRRSRLGRRRRDGVPERAGVARDQARRHRAKRSPPARTRSTWSSTAGRSSPGATGSCSTRSPA